MELVLVFVLGGVPFIKAGGRDHAALEGNTAAKHRLFRHRFGAAINDIVSAHPECSETTITYDYEDGHTWASYWPEVLAIFAVHTNLNSDSDVVVINAAQMQRIQDIFWAMHEITYEVEEVDTTPEPTEDDPDPEQQTEYILHITVNSKTVDELAELYNFTQDQNDILHELLSDEMRPTLLALCGGISIIEDGELCWPLPGHTYISCNFGDDDAYGNSGHRGTDIPAPEGTPILAAHSGTVLVSGWNDSYGNQVLLDNGAGLSTRYAHMTQTAVTAGEAVTAGQVIGYVGNTGDSTGFHLHFEVMYKDDWESLVGLCDEFLYLGGTEKETHKYVSELLGKETISTTSYNQSKGRSGSYSINHQQSGRDLMTPDEVRLLDNSKCILFIRGERPVIDLKYNLLKHPNIRYTEDGGAAPYDYTAADNARDDLPGAPENYELLDMDDFLPAEAAEMKPTIQRIRRST